MTVKNVEKRENSTVAFMVEVDSAAFEAALNRAYMKNRKSISIPGFRRGKAPRKIIESMYGPATFYDDAINEISHDAFELGAENEKLETVGRPSLENVDISDDKTVTLSFVTAVYPEVTLGEYKNLEAPREEAAVSDTEVMAELERIRKRGARHASVEREAKMGDTVMIDFEGFLEGQPFEGGKGLGHGLTLGSGQFIPGFEEQLVGCKAGDEKSLDITFPEDYQEQLAGKACVFKVKVNEVREEQLPELDDEFAKDVSEFDTLDEYKERIRADLQKQQESAADDAFRRKLIEKAIENMTVQIPDAMIEFRQDVVIGEYAQKLAMQGMSIENYFNMTGMSPDVFRQSARPIALQQVQVDLLLSKIADVEGIEVTDEEFEDECAQISEIYGIGIPEVKEQIGEERIRNDARLKKASDVITESGVPVVPTATVLGKKLPDDKTMNEDNAEAPAPKKTVRKTAKKPAADGE